MAKKKASTPSFEEALQELEDIVKRMEEGNLPLEESLSAFERGIQLTRQCQTALKEAEQKVQILMEKDGQAELAEFQSEDE